MNIPTTSTFRDGLSYIRRKTGISRRPIIKALGSGDLHACIFLERKARQIVILPSTYFKERGGDDFDKGDHGRSVSIRLSEVLEDLGDTLDAIGASIVDPGSSSRDRSTPLGAESDEVQQRKQLVDRDHPLREFQFFVESSPAASETMVDDKGRLDVAAIQRTLIANSDKIFRLHFFDREVDEFIIDHLGSDRRKPGPVSVDLNESYWFALLEKLGLKSQKLPHQGAILDAMEKWCKDPTIQSPDRSVDISDTSRGQIQRQLTEIWRILKAKAENN
ncbi:hypothetical protein [Devosia sp.]|uniref:hypothetical protein n=1 Tax=Devosia sp. TaxID=1871048 RepID=UPI0035B17319